MAAFVSRINPSIGVLEFNGSLDNHLTEKRGLVCDMSRKTAQC